MEKDFIPYDRALKLKELGFDEPCLAWYGSEEIFEISGRYKNSTHTVGYCVSAPTFSQVFRWFRNEHLLNGVPDNWKNQWCFEIVKLLDSEYLGNKKHHEWAINSREDYNKLYYTYEEAELACLDKLIEIVESKEKEI